MAIPQVEFQVPDEDQLKLTPPSANPEPPELVAEYYALWAEIEKEQLDGELDSTKVLRANRLAIELAKYDGPMAEVFATLEFAFDGLARGRSREWIDAELMMQNVASSATTISPECKECEKKFGDATNEAMWDAINEVLECGGEAATGMVGALFTGPGAVPVALVSFTWGIGCMGWQIYEYEQEMRKARIERRTCLEEHGCKVG